MLSTKVLIKYIEINSLSTLFRECILNNIRKLVIYQQKVTKIRKNYPQLYKWLINIKIMKKIKGKYGYRT